MKTDFKIGCDPEIFVYQPNVGFRSIIGTIGGSKDCPRPMPIGDGFAVQEDNVAMEFNIPAAASKTEFITSINKARNFLSTLMNDQYGWLLSKESAAVFPDSELENPMAQVFGCDPDFNAWTKRKNPFPKAPNKSLRSAGGHVHVGTDLTDEERYRLIQAMDFYLGVPSILMDKGEERKQLYGKAGAMRIKPYGVEYRTLSNFWIFEDRYISWVYDQTERALDAVRVGTQFTPLRKEITTCINGNNKELAQQLVDEYELKLVMQ